MRYVRWSTQGAINAQEIIIPDGCRDIIVVKQGGAARDVFLTALDWRPRLVRLRANRQLFGYRLRPGIRIENQELANLVVRGDFAETGIQGIAHENTEMVSLVEILAQTDDSIGRVARRAGVSERTLQRYFKRRNMPKPEFWRLLGRARRAARALLCRTPPVEIAFAFGYSDQAHMTREFTRWFGTTPVRLRQRPNLLERICQPGLGNWTGEQISIK
ncbi:MAG: AraC family transcriptional regulator [Pseudomonadota bacterium]